MGLVIEVKRTILVEIVVIALNVVPVVSSAVDEVGWVVEGK